MSLSVDANDRHPEAPRGGDGKRGYASISRTEWEVERAAVARHLHDGVGQPITSLLMEVEHARSTGPIASEALDRIEALARLALQSARRAVLAMSDAVDYRDPLEAARDYSQSALALAGCELVWEELPDLVALPMETARQLASMIRESVTNVVRHAAAQTVYVRMVRRGNRVVVTIEDDGQGWAGRLDAHLGTGFGLRSNRELAKSLGGSFRISPRTAGGTVVRFRAVIGTDD